MTDPGMDGFQAVGDGSVVLGGGLPFVRDQASLINMSEKGSKEESFAFIVDVDLRRVIPAPCKDIPGPRLSGR